MRALSSSPTLAVIVISAKEQYSERSQVVSGLISQLVSFYARVSIWAAAYGLQGVVAGIPLQDMITYSLVAGIVTVAWEPQRLVAEVGEAVSTGSVAASLAKPMSYYNFILAQAAGNCLFRIPVLVLPLVAIFYFTVGIQPPRDLQAGLLYAVLVAEGLGLGFLIASLFGICVFWIMTSFSLEWLLQGLITLLSGAFVPFWFFPQALGRILEFTPFAYLGFLPAAAYLGRLDGPASLNACLLGLLWLAILAVASRSLWQSTVNRIIVNGG